MTQNQFITTLRRELLKRNVLDTETHINYYQEIIADYIEDGFTEESAVAKIGAIDDIVATITKEKNQPIDVIHKNSKSPLIWTLLIIGSPLWLSILLSIILLIASGIIILWCLPLTLGSLSFAFLLTGIVSLVGATFNSGIYYVVTQLGVGIFTAGLGLLLLLGTTYSSQVIFSLTKKLSTPLTRIFRQKGRLF
ncbi:MULTISPECIES: DUF1700 domain-containing protein [Vagococcus]|uniref:Integral membrane protein (Putative) n=1 Tax=Vagococcus fluvialis bH819 TaxID=1255619 RepID=A0A1X6WNM5_9ENTE|nr:MULTISPECIES: DUF1700 domain-containing protein [Vagococcus]SLM85858.1 hypothetical protein FM121_07135 [Vagococcus fluvialis bH819]HCM90280.1 DUF1700 domain-containing protein [Vagococcus sp.]